MHCQTPSTRPRAHLVGIAGSGMRALAEFLLDAGWQLTGSDLRLASATADHFARLGIQIVPADWIGPWKADSHVLIHSPAVPVEDPARQEARRLGVEDLSYPEILARLMIGRETTCIAGTHGKSTTTALTGWIVQTAGFQPGVILGAEIRQIARGGWMGGGGNFIVEACEFGGHFLHYSPRRAAILSIEPDHFDTYSEFSDLQAAFQSFAQRIPPDGLLVAPAGEGPIDWRRVTAARVETFGFDPSADWSASNWQPTAEGGEFLVRRQGSVWGRVRMRVPGQHNMLNALAAVALAQDAGADCQACLAGLADFPGLKRRFEPLGEWAGIEWIDDYAHHPTAIAVTIACARENFPGRRLVGVFQPHQLSRTTRLFESFARELARLDVALISPVFMAREQADDGAAQACSRRLVARTVELGGIAEYLTALDPIPRTLDDSLRTGDVLLTMGAGDINRLHHAFTRRLQRDHGP